MKSLTYAYGFAIVAGAALVLYALAQPKAAVRKAVTVAGDAVAGAAEGAGELVGVPLTDPDKCQACIAARDWWNASFYCPAGTFLQALTGLGTTSSPDAPKVQDAQAPADTPPPGAPATSAQPGQQTGAAPAIPGADLSTFPYGVSL